MGCGASTKAATSPDPQPAQPVRQPSQPKSQSAQSSEKLPAAEQPLPAAEQPLPAAEQPLPAAEQPPPTVLARYELISSAKLGEGASGDVVLGLRRASIRRPLAHTRRPSKRLSASRRPSFVPLSPIDAAATVGAHVDKLCAIKVIDISDREGFDIEVNILQQLTGSGYCPQLLDHSIVDDAQPPSQLHIIMERGLLTLEQRIKAATEFSSEVLEAPLDQALIKVSPHETLIKTWRVKNTGTRPWLGDGSVTLVHVRGDDMSGAPMQVPAAAPGEIVDVSVTLVALKEDPEAPAWWRLKHGSEFGQVLEVDICVWVNRCECGFSGTLEEVSAHEKLCEQATYTCECGFEGIYAVVAAHEQLCEQAIAAAASETEEEDVAVATDSTKHQVLQQQLSLERTAQLVQNAICTNELQDIMRRLVEGLSRLQELGHVHLDVKSANAMKFVDGRWALIDFGTVTPLSEWMGAPMEFTCEYMAPEMATIMFNWWSEEDEAKADTFGIHAASTLDMFSLGLVFLEMLTPGVAVLHDAYIRCEEDEEWYRWLSVPGHLEGLLQRRFEAIVDPLARELAASMVNRDPKERPTFKNCLEHPWMRQ